MASWVYYVVPPTPRMSKLTHCMIEFRKGELLESGNNSDKSHANEKNEGIQIFVLFFFFFLTD